MQYDGGGGGGDKPMREIYANHNAWGITIARCPSWIYKRWSGRQRHILISGMPVELPGITLQIHTYLFASAPAVSINVARIFSPFVACTLYTGYLPCGSRFLWTNVWSSTPTIPHPLRFRRFLDVVAEFRWKPSVQVSQCSYLLL